MRTRLPIVVAVAAVVLGGCGLIDDAKERARDEIAEVCTERTEADEQTCRCVADRLAENVALETLQEMIDATARGDIPPEMERALESCS